MKTWAAHQKLEPQRAWRGIAATNFYHRGTAVGRRGKTPSLGVSSGAGGEKRGVIIKNLFLAATAALLLAGCSYPDPAKVEQKDPRPVIGISGAPEGTLLFVDGLNMGPATRDEKEVNVLFVESGNHVVELKSASGEVLLSEEVFLSASTTKILPYNP